MYTPLLVVNNTGISLGRGRFGIAAGANEKSRALVSAEALSRALADERSGAR